MFEYSKKLSKAGDKRMTEKAEQPGRKMHIDVKAIWSPTHTVLPSTSLSLKSVFWPNL